jgi:nitroreductase
MKILPVLLLILLVAFPVGVPAAEGGLAPISLLEPVTEGGKPLMEALRLRSTSREFAPTPLPDQLLSNLLWAAWGINRPDGKRTAPSAMNRQEIDLYVAMERGLYLYDAKGHRLVPVVAGDLRTLTGRQPFVAKAPATLVTVADLERMGNAPDSEKEPWAAAGAACISQNVYLFCASEGLVTGVRAAIDKPALAAAMKLAANQRVIFAQTVGYPPK